MDMLPAAQSSMASIWERGAGKICRAGTVYPQSDVCAPRLRLFWI